MQLIPEQLQNAIFVDFECLATTPPHPALLGVLVGVEGEDFEQLIIDERLVPARAARPGCTRVEAAADAVRTVVGMAAVNGSPIVGWSDFDRDRMIEACPDLVEDIKGRYVNALHIARPWRKTIYPTFAIEREDEYSPKNTLVKYACLAGYPSPGIFRDAAPADWIRHVPKQLKTTAGNYGRTTRQTKRDWDQLLKYNRHDCLALRHIVLKAARELDCWRAYQRTNFCVDDGPRRLCFMAGSRSAKLEALLKRHGARRWAFITAWNPGSEPQSSGDNARRQRELRRIVDAGNYSALSGEGVGEDPGWQPEESLLILDIEEREAVRLGQEFGQLAIVAGQLGSPSRLIPCARPPAVNAGRQRRPPASTTPKSPRRNH